MLPLPDGLESVAVDVDLGALVVDTNSSGGLPLPDDEKVFALRLLELETRLRGQALYFMRGDHDAADDLFQEICIRLWAKSDSYRGDGSFSAWAFRVADSVCLNARRGRHRLGCRVPVSDGVLLSVSGGTEAELALQSLAEEQAAQAIWDAVDALPPRPRAVILLHYRFGWKAPLIAQSLNLAIPSVWTSLSQARRTLRRKLRPSSAAGER